MTKTQWTAADFDSLRWHDNHVHGLGIREGECGAGQLVLDLDLILEWRRGVDETYSFVLAPADLVFEEVTELEVRLDYKGMAIGPLSIGEIRREATAETERCGLYRWTIAFNFPKGDIVFLGTGFVQTLRAAPVESWRQSLTWQQRIRSKVHQDQDDAG